MCCQQPISPLINALIAIFNLYLLRYKAPSVRAVMRIFGRTGSGVGLSLHPSLLTGFSFIFKSPGSGRNVRLPHFQECGLLYPLLLV
jgi:hypothetical protein